jgi:hypothetical protein
MVLFCCVFLQIKTVLSAQIFHPPHSSYTELIEIAYRFKNDCMSYTAKREEK